MLQPECRICFPATKWVKLLDSAGDPIGSIKSLNIGKTILGYCIYRYNCMRFGPISTIFLKYVSNTIESGSILVWSVGFANYLNWESDTGLVTAS